MLINTEIFIKGSLLVAGLSFLLGGLPAGFIALTSIALIAASNNTHFYTYHAPYYQRHSSYPSPWIFPSWPRFSRPATHAGAAVYLNRQPAAPRPVLYQYPHYQNQSQRTPDSELVNRHFVPAHGRSGYRSWFRP